MADSIIKPSASGTTILKEEGGRTRDYLKNAIKAIKGDPPERIDRNVEVAVSKHKADGKVLEDKEGVLVLADRQDGDEWEQI